MSFKQFYREEIINEQKVHSYKYTERIKNFKELSTVLSKVTTDKSGFFEKKDSRTIEVFINDRFIGEIKDKGKSFEIDASVFKEVKVLKLYIEKEL